MGAINAPRLTPAVCPSASVALIDHRRLYRQSISRYLSRVSGDGAYTARIMEQIASLFLGASSSDGTRESGVLESALDFCVSSTSSLRRFRDYDDDRIKCSPLNSLERSVK